MTLYCSKCGYNLTNQQDNCCPWCEEGFDPEKLQALQGSGLSTLSVILQLIFVPMGIAVLSLVVLCGAVAISTEALAYGLSFATLLCVALPHTIPLSRAFVRSKKLRFSEHNVAWIFRDAWPCCVLFTLVESVLAFGYLVSFLGGCAAIMTNIDYR